MTTTLRIHHSTHRGTSVTNPTRCSQPLTSLSGGGLLAPTSLLNALGYKTVLLILAQTKGKIKVFYNECVVPQNLTGTVGGEGVGTWRRRSRGRSKTFRWTVLPPECPSRQASATGRTRAVFSTTQKKTAMHLHHGLAWRRRRDSNPRTGYPAYTLSRGASSPT